MKIDEALIKRVEEITKADYHFNKEGETKEGDLLVRDLVDYYNNLEEEFEDFKEHSIRKIEEFEYED